ncbi:hypothetical protein O7635_12005 [Asanoa sp. WMMD1127]|uniref:hypothetical protein n=1 Tax=Asanoa sp. WMMD1127 TaxID=3016107 RepID=UPI0024176FFD|nr:hypothetical protein [Asanoa sp. WMMD1127]MDG4822575.1 hypothetical protein [Asanoa sp. WMMD1127]
MQKRSKRVLAATLAAAGVFAAGGVAYAFSDFFTTGPVEGAAAQMEPLTVGTVTIDYANEETQLWSGDNHKASIIIPVTNENEVGVTVTSADVVNTLLSIGGGTTCAEALNLAEPIVIDNGSGGSTGSISIPKDGTATIRVLDAVWLDGTAPDSCQGRAITTKWKVTANSQ